MGFNRRFGSVDTGFRDIWVLSDGLVRLILGSMEFEFHPMVSFGWYWVSSDSFVRLVLGPIKFGFQLILSFGWYWVRWNWGFIRWFRSVGTGFHGICVLSNDLIQLVLGSMEFAFHPMISFGWYWVPWNFVMISLVSKFHSTIDSKRALVSIRR